MSGEEPAPRAGLSGAALWAAYLHWMREEVIAGVLDLAYDDQRTPRVPSGWTPLELLSHVLHMEQRWFVRGFLGEHVADPWGDWDVEEPWRDGVEGRWRVPPEATAEVLARRLREIGERTGRILGDHALEARASVRGRLGDDPPTLEWICFHVLTEYSRHAGHLDIVVEIAGS